MSRIVSILLIFLSYSIFSQKNLINVDSIIKTDNYNVIKNIEYGEAERNVLDLWIANKNKNSPLMIFIHGGGFFLGNKESAYRKNSFNRIKNLLIMEFLLLLLIIDLEIMKMVLLLAQMMQKEPYNFFDLTVMCIV